MAIQIKAWLKVNTGYTNDAMHLELTQYTSDPDVVEVAIDDKDVRVSLEDLREAVERFGR